MNLNERVAFHTNVENLPFRVRVVLIPVEPSGWRQFDTKTDADAQAWAKYKPVPPPEDD